LRFELINCPLVGRAAINGQSAIAAILKQERKGDAGRNQIQSDGDSDAKPLKFDLIFQTWLVIVCGGLIDGVIVTENQVLNITIRLTDANGSPISDAKLVCHDASGLLGTTDADGLIHLSVAGVGTSAGVFYSRCDIAFVRKKDLSTGSPFWFGKFMRGEEVHSGDDRIELIDDGRTKSE